MTVHYPDGLVLTDDQHAALHAMDADPNGLNWDPRGKEQAQQFHDFNIAEAEAKAEAELAAEGAVPDQAPDGTWTVAQIDAYAAEREIEDYPKDGNKADKLAAIEAA